MSMSLEEYSSLLTVYPVQAYRKCIGSRGSLLVERRTRDRKVAIPSKDRSGRRIFFSRINILCRLIFGVRSTPCYRSGT